MSVRSPTLVRGSLLSRLIHYLTRGDLSTTRRARGRPEDQARERLVELDPVQFLRIL